MIVTSEDKKVIDAASASPVVQMALMDTSSVPIAPHDPPPAYTDPSNTITTLSTSVASPLPPLPPAPRDSKVIKPTNYVSMIRSNQSVKGSFIIDPSLQIPPSLLAPLAYGETDYSRKNLRVESRNGSVEIDVSVTTRNPEVKAGKVSMYVRSSNGSVSTRLHDAEPSSSRPRHPVHLTCHASNGSMSIQVPRSFHGPVTLVINNGWARLSDPIDSHLTTFSEAAGTRRCFIGDFSQWTEDGWEGDELIVEAKNGGVKLQFDDEYLERGTSRGFLARLLGL